MEEPPQSSPSRRALTIAFGIRACRGSRLVLSSSGSQSPAFSRKLQRPGVAAVVVSTRPQTWLECSFPQDDRGTAVIAAIRLRATAVPPSRSAGCHRPNEQSFTHKELLQDRVYATFRHHNQRKDIRGASLASWGSGNLSQFQRGWHRRHDFQRCWLGEGSCPIPPWRSSLATRRQRHLRMWQTAIPSKTWAVVCQNPRPS